MNRLVSAAVLLGAFMLCVGTGLALPADAKPATKAKSAKSAKPPAPVAAKTEKVSLTVNDASCWGFYCLDATLKDDKVQELCYYHPSNMYSWQLNFTFENSRVSQVKEWKIHTVTNGSSSTTTYSDPRTYSVRNGKLLSVTGNPDWEKPMTAAELIVQANLYKKQIHAARKTGNAKK